MDSLQEFLNMGGYAKWVWGAYGISAVGVIGLLVWSLGTLRAREKEFAALKSARNTQ